ncbi:ArsR/SmtB family transcription factor [Streptosporangium sp. KLBMP 9127]|nr:metalloregulator ArsR/SmtB family transcription factor [Streptosporangium sp. KLBMP 9127]MCG5220780.1 metalloregulator ArsR/SmtB family transcription factor [Streptosporangium sp. KLBMP 9127]
MRPPDSEGQAVAVFTALTDPTRRALLEELARAGPATVTDLARRLPVSRQAVAKHLGQLADAGLISVGEPVGRRHPYRLEPAAVRTAQVWLAALANRWDDRLAALERALDAIDTNQGVTPE